MNSDQIMNAAFLGLLGAAIAGSYLVSQRGNMGKVAQQAAIWGLIFLGVVAAYGLWGDVSRDVSQRQSYLGTNTISVPQSPDGHYYLTLQLNGQPVDFVVDTGASMVVLSQPDARRIGLDPDTLHYSGNASTANGVVSTAPVWLDTVTLGPITDTRVPAVVNGGEMAGSLLGMSYLDAFSQISFADGELRLTR